MGFGYKTQWIAVRDRSPAEVADALDLDRRESVGWVEGTLRAYDHGVYVASPRPGWTLAHVAWHLPDGLEASATAFPDWLAGLSKRLGEVQFFGTHRVTEYHAWARARDGEIVRAYCYLGERNCVYLSVGEPTAAEQGIVLDPEGLDVDTDTWSDDDWDAWTDAKPDEEAVLRIAGAWGVGPDQIDDDEVTSLGIHGVPAGAG
ncbi:hypothetical protein AB0J90_31075 [Micromonospora sp. NPDC049523]|uniref:hypothetical protein n=1 Tax=Micromonospora sp. NPDC049523 TaxID=3155921 RepID=UPI0034235B8D